ncbi:hypothetical protein [Jiangella gansuensis]|uniref:hypothetical protein n=1 Tax=Jiangella gansuensis TaxID=281473 RepID=UPI00047CBE27|nr:hypothetical protein [Jiangella gansuensis]
MPTPFKQLRPAAAVAAVVALGAVLAGCGGDDDPQALATTTPAATAEAPATPTADPAAPTETPATTAPADPVPPHTAEQPPAAEQEQPPAGETAPDPDPAPPVEPPAAETDPEPETDPGTEPDPGTDGAPDGSAAQVCTLGAQAITGLLGASATPVADEADPGICYWTGEGGQELIVSVSTYDDWVPAGAVPGTPPTAVSGLGDEAWASLGASSNLQVAWRRASISASISASLASGGTALPDIARTIDAALQASGS